jgi:hypothetical protein
MLQYWRCTQQVPYADVASCVESSAVKIDWLPQFMNYNGAPSCSSAASVLGRQASSVISDILTRFLSATIVAVLMNKLKKKLFGSRTKADASDGIHLGAYRGLAMKGGADATAEPSRDVNQTSSTRRRQLILAPKHCFERESTWVFQASSVLKSLGSQVVSAYLTVIILQKGGRIGTASTNFAFLQLLAFYTIRPRAAPVMGILGFMKGFSKDGFGDVFADFAVSAVAGTTILVPL